MHGSAIGVLSYDYFGDQQAPSFRILVSAYRIAVFVCVIVVLVGKHINMFFCRHLEIPSLDSSWESFEYSGQKEGLEDALSSTHNVSRLRCSMLVLLSLYLCVSSLLTRY